MITPIALFTYSRLDHTRRTIEALLRNRGVADHDLIIFSDAPSTPDKAAAVAAVRGYLNTVTGFRSISIRARDHNFGLAKSIISGVTEVLEHYDRVVVLEDDMVTSPFFLAFMNDALDRFSDDDRVISVHGYVYPVSQVLPEVFFLRGADCWGWATWRRGWRLFNPDGRSLLQELKRRRLTRLFDFNGAYGYTSLLEAQNRGRVDSWAIRWHASAFLAGKLTLYPGRSLVRNIGHDGSGTHCGADSAWNVRLADERVHLDSVAIEESPIAHRAFEQHFRRARGLMRRIYRELVGFYYRQMFSPTVPGLFINPFFLARRGLVRAISDLSTNLSGRLVDIGCGTRPYQGLFNVDSYRGLDLDTIAARERGVADDFYDGTNFPYESLSFDSVLCNQVLEHVFNPEQFLSEIHRVLKPGGKMLLTVPFVWDEHEQPNDYARYSSFGLAALLERNGFKVLIHKKLGADASTLFQLANAYFYKLSRRWPTPVRFFFTVSAMALLNIFGIVAGRLLPRNEDLYLDHIVLAEKS